MDIKRNELVDALAVLAASNIYNGKIKFSKDSKTFILESNYKTWYVTLDNGSVQIIKNQWEGAFLRPILQGLLIVFIICLVAAMWLNNVWFLAGCFLLSFAAVVLSNNSKELTLDINDPKFVDDYVGFITSSWFKKIIGY